MSNERTRWTTTNGAPRWTPDLRDDEPCPPRSAERMDPERERQARDPHAPENRERPNTGAFKPEPRGPKAKSDLAIEDATRLDVAARFGLPLRRRVVDVVVTARHHAKPGPRAYVLRPQGVDAPILNGLAPQGDG